MLVTTNKCSIAPVIGAVLLQFAPIILLTGAATSNDLQDDYDSQGYIMYCPCMGRFGNQAEQLLGSLLFAKSLNRTLLLPPFIHYGLNHVALMEPFENIIQLEPIRKYHKVLPMEDFMRYHANKIWPVGSRKFFCYSSRDNSRLNLNTDDQVQAPKTCDALRGQPFESFWNAFNISEDASIIYKPLSTSPNQVDAWNKRYPPQNYPVLAFVGAPSPFPTHRDAIHIQKYIKISDYIEKAALEFKQINKLSGKPYISIHLRHGIDWRKACEFLKNDEHGGLKEFFSSNQCTKYKPNELAYKNNLQYDTCLPSFETIKSKLNNILNYYETTKNLTIRVIHVATDYNDTNLHNKLKSSFPKQEIFTTPRTLNTIHESMIDIYLMTNADVFIGNCVSSFSAFPARIRAEQLNLDHRTHYFGQNFDEIKGDNRDEL